MATFELKRRGVPYAVEGSTRVDAERRLESALTANPEMEDIARAKFVQNPGAFNEFVIGAGRQVDMTLKGLRQSIAEVTGDRRLANEIAQQIANDNRAFADLDEGFGPEDLGQIAVEALKIGIGGPVSQVARAFASGFASGEEEEQTGDLRDRFSRGAISAAVPTVIRGPGLALGAGKGAVTSARNFIVGAFARMRGLGANKSKEFAKNIHAGTQNITAPGILQFLTSPFGKSAVKPLSEGLLPSDIVNKAVVASLMGTGTEYLMDVENRVTQQEQNPRPQTP